MDEWLPAVLEAMGVIRGSQMHVGDGQDTSFSGDLPDASMSGGSAPSFLRAGGAVSPAAASLESTARDRVTLSWVRLLADAFLEAVNEQVKPVPQTRKGWRRPGFGEPPLSRFQTGMPVEEKKKSWEMVRQRLEEVMKHGGKTASAAAAETE